MDLDEVLFQKSSFYLMDFIQVCKRMASFSPPLNDTRCVGTDFCLNSTQSFVATVLFPFMCLWIPGSVSEKQQGEVLGCRLASIHLARKASLPMSEGFAVQAWILRSFK